MSSSETKPVPLVIQASSPVTEISVVDANLEPVPLPANAGRVEVELPPGLYRIDFREGTGRVQTFVTLLPDQKEATVEQPAPAEFRTAVPLSNTSTTHEWHEGPTRALGQQPAVSIGDGSAGLWIVVRDIGNPELQTGERPDEAQPKAVWPKIHELPPSDPSLGLTLRDEHGNLLVDLHQRSIKWPKSCFSGHRFLCDSAFYRLRLDTGAEVTVEMPLVTCTGWQTQVFLICRSYGGDDRRADLARASVSLVPLSEEAFDANDSERRLAEIALQALARQRPLRGSELDDLLRKKFYRPMLGIFGAHLLCLQEQVDLGLLAEVVGNLVHLTSSPDGALHPDVAALKLKLALLRGEPWFDVEPFHWPPMLLASWRILLEASRKDPGLVQADSLTDRMADKVWGGGPWLLWSADEERPETRSVWNLGASYAVDAVASEPTALAEVIREIRAALEDPEVQQWFRRTTALSGLERAVAQFLFPALRLGVERLLRNARALELLQISTTDWSAERLSRLLEVPAGTAERIARDVHDKLLQARHGHGSGLATR